MANRSKIFGLIALGVTAATLGACGHNPAGFGGTAHLSDRECMARAMYFESNRSSDDGMVAVGTVVMNRLQSPKYPKTVCGVVGQHKQFADGALTKPVQRRHSSWARAERAADAVLAGQRHAGVGSAMFFHTEGYSFPYRNMRYVTLAGGNIFYEKQNPVPGAPAWPSSSMFAANHKGAPTSRIMLARAETASEPAAEDHRSLRSGTSYDAPARTGRRPAAEDARPVVLARAAVPKTPVLDEEDDLDTVPEVPVRRERPYASTAMPLRTVKPQPVVVASSAKPSPIVLASASSKPTPKWQPADIAATLRDTKAKPAVAVAAARPVQASRMSLVAAATASSRPEKTRPAAVAAAQPPAKPDRVVLAMAGDERVRQTPPPRSIGDLLAKGGDGRRVLR